MAILTKTVYELIPEGIYAARIVAMDDDEGQFGPQIRFTFALGEGRELTAWASQTLSARSKLGIWVTALLGALPDKLDTSTLVGILCRVKTEVVMKPDGTEFSRVVAVLPARKAPPPQPVAELDDADLF